MKYSIREINSIEKWKEISPFLYIYRKLSIIFVWFLLRTPLSPNAVSNLSVLFGVLAAVGFASGERNYILLGGFMSQIYMILDCADGLLARTKKICTKFGAVYDVVTDVSVNNIVLFGICIGIYLQMDRLDHIIFPLLALFGMNMTVITHNTQMMVFRDEPLSRSFIIKEIGKRKKLLQKIIIRSGLSGSFQFFIIGFGALLNQLIWSAIVIAVVQNIYWISIVILMYINYKKETHAFSRSS